MASSDKGFVTGPERILAKLRFFQAESEENFKLGRRTIVRQVIVGGTGYPKIQFYHRCNRTRDLPLDVGETLFRRGIFEAPFTLNKWGDLPVFYTQVQEAFATDVFREEIYEFIDGLVTRLAGELERLNDMRKVNEDPNPTEDEVTYCKKVHDTLEEARKAGLNLVVCEGDEEISTPAHTECDMERKRCPDCQCLIPCLPGEYEAPAYSPYTPSYSEPGW